MLLQSIKKTIEPHSIDHYTWVLVKVLLKKGFVPTRFLVIVLIVTLGLI